MLQRGSVLVVLVAAGTGSVLAGGAHALGHALGHEVITGATTPSTRSASGASAAGGGPEEADDPHGAMSDNPYDDAAPAHAAAPFRVSVPAKDGMLRLPGGRFTVGSSNPKAPANERPAHAVTLGPFWMDRTEVTVSAYRACVDAGVCARPARASASCTFDRGDGDLPVSCVHWSDADAYCRFAGKRLPTEIEWEFGARGTQNVGFPWGAAPSCTNAVTLQNDATGRGCATGPTHVGSHPAGDSVFGLADMSGNLEEWTADWYAESLGSGPGLRVGSAHVLRGGGWQSPPSSSRTTSRDWGSAIEAGANVGFRCVRGD